MLLGWPVLSEGCDGDRATGAGLRMGFHKREQKHMGLLCAGSGPSCCHFCRSQGQPELWEGWCRCSEVINGKGQRHGLNGLLLSWTVSSSSHAKASGKSSGLTATGLPCRPASAVPAPVCQSSCWSSAFPPEMGGGEGQRAPQITRLVHGTTRGLPSSVRRVLNRTGVSSEHSRVRPLLEKGAFQLSQPRPTTLLPG